MSYSTALDRDTHLICCSFDKSDCFLWCLHMMVAAMTKKPVLARMMRMTGAMKAQMK